MYLGNSHKKNWSRFYGFALILLLVGSFACSSKILNGKAEDFDTFYNRFHSDPQFQLDRVKFPLDGSYEDEAGQVVWSKSNWQMHRQKVTDISEPNYDTEIIRKKTEVTDKVQLRGAGYYSIRKFQLVDGRWYLVFYDAADL